MKPIFSFLIGLFYIAAFAQKDTITFKNKDVIVGELKQMTSNIIILKTDYSDKDFNIEFDKIASLNLEHRYSVALSNGLRVYGYIKTTAEKKVVIMQDNNIGIEVEFNQIVSLRKIDDGFWKHFKGSFDFGYVDTKTNNSKQFNFAGALNYSSERWIHRAQYNQLATTQDDAEDIERVDCFIETKRYLKRKWFLSSNLSFLSNTSQEIEGRFAPNISAGNYLIRNNKLYFLTGAGLTYNIENYTDSDDNKQSTEMSILTQFSMFNFKNIDLYFSATGYPSLSEKGRFRSDLNFKIKYDMPYDFYFKTEIQVNYDNQPVALAVKTDYVFSTGIGWELK